MRLGKPALVLVPLLLAAAPALLLLRRDSPGRSDPPPAPETLAAAAERLRALPSPFVPNLGQWEHPARYVAHIGAMTVFLEEKGWTFTLEERTGERRTRPQIDARAAREPGPVSTRGVAVRMTFEGACAAELAAEDRLPGRHNYLLGNDESRWRTGVPLYGSVRYENLYPGIDLRLREMNGVPEYDLLLQPGADLSLVTVHVEGGGEGLSMASDGSLVIETALGPVTQSVPKTWQVGHDGRKREVVCNFTLLGVDRFGFAAPGWDGHTSLTIDPGLIWSTFLGGSRCEGATAVSVDASGVVTVAGSTVSADFPTTSGAYDRTYNGPQQDAFVSRLDPSKTGAAQLVYSTFLGGRNWESPNALSVDASGVVTVGGETHSTDFPTTSGAYDTTLTGKYDGFVSRLDPSKTGTAQLVYSTFLGGWAGDTAIALSVGASGVVTVAGETPSPNFPTTSGAYDTTYNGNRDGFVSRLDPSKTGTAQLVYSTFLGGSSIDRAEALSADSSGVVTVAGPTLSLDFPTTSGAYDTTFNGGSDGFVSRLDPSKTGTAQLVYSTFLGGSLSDIALELSVDTQGAATVAGYTSSANFPTTPGAYDTTYNGRQDAFVSRLDPSKTGTAQLVYSTFLGGTGLDSARALALDAQGAATVAGVTFSSNFPTTPGAFDTTFNGVVTDAFVSRLDMLPTGVSAFGRSSPGCKGPLAISVTSWPKIGNTAFSITCGNAPPSVSGLLALSLAPQTAPIRWLGIDIWVDVAPGRLSLLGAGSNPRGAAEVPLPIPATPVLVGKSVYAQFVWAGPSSPRPCPPLGLSASNALAITIHP